MWGADAQAPRRGRITFKVRNHGWTEESPLSFVHGRVGGWSYVIATDDQCVEMLEDDYQKRQTGLVGRHGRCRYDPASKNRLVAACLEPFACETCARTSGQREPSVQVEKRAQSQPLAPSSSPAFIPVQFKSTSDRALLRQIGMAAVDWRGLAMGAWVGPRKGLCLSPLQPR